MVNQYAGCLDLSDSTSKFFLSRTHFDMNKFENAQVEDFQTVAEVLQNIVKASPGLMIARSQCKYTTVVPAVSNKIG